MNCNATLTLLVNVDEHTDRTETVTCDDEANHFGFDHISSGESYPDVRWTDDAPGAHPHTRPRYRAEIRPSGAWAVVGGLDGQWRAMFHPQRHPDPDGAAEREAARLNGEDMSDCGFESSPCRTAHGLATQRDAFRAALENIASVQQYRALYPSGSLVPEYKRIAREALEGADHHG